MECGKAPFQDIGCRRFSRGVGGGLSPQDHPRVPISGAAISSMHTPARRSPQCGRFQRCSSAGLPRRDDLENVPACSRGVQGAALVPWLQASTGAGMPSGGTWRRAHGHQSRRDAGRGERSGNVPPVDRAAARRWAVPRSTACRPPVEATNVRASCIERAIGRARQGWAHECAGEPVTGGEMGSKGDVLSMPWRMLAGG
jgi:hypothetical protein